ncbi:hypothetical protein HRI_002058500 [Hibiscus trionum]|uniref:Endonuclease/exonuclease/phosphatase domain-containing protein n=1 Tax=Hibiscus trionum TaxID=183268 RepID=A0A9W7HVU9_HIBTR|nr:hypothetical protein HRI_002058500 [Hibiscus trionum]
MTLFTWNVRGFNDPLKRKSVLKVVNSYKVDILCLLETRVKEGNAVDIVNSHFQGWELFNNYEHAVNGRVWILSRGCWSVRMVSSSAQFIMCLVSNGVVEFYLSVIYASNSREERRKLWRDLVCFKGCVDGLPWVLVGDFNVTLYPKESSYFSGSQGISGAMKDFSDCLEDLDVLDHPFQGPMFTWCNMREEQPLARKLDRILVNQLWISKFGDSGVEFLPPGCSDHCPSFLVFNVGMVSPPKPFKFFNFWIGHPEFHYVIESSWNQTVSGNPLQALFAKLKRLKEPLRMLN